jgi:acetyltransferase
VPGPHGARSQSEGLKDRLAEAICRFAQLAGDATDVVELEVNPLVAGPDGVVAVDARARMK